MAFAQTSKSPGRNDSRSFASMASFTFSTVTAVSYPGFLDELAALGAALRWR